MKRSTFAAVLASAVLLGCQGDRTTAPDGQIPLFDFSDGRTEGGVPGFFFFPPIADNPQSEPGYDRDLFSPDLSPTVEICALDPAGNCVGDPIATFTGDDITTSAHQYHVNWATRDFDLDDGTNYRIAVLVAGTLVGFADADIISSGKDKKNVDESAFVPVVNGSTLPIKFHLDPRIFCGTDTDCVAAVVGDEGGTVTTPSANGGADFPSGWLPEGMNQVVVIIERVEVDEDHPCLPATSHLIQVPACYTFTTIPDLETFSEPVVAGVCVEVDESDPLFDLLQLHKFDPEDEVPVLEALENVAAPFVECPGVEQDLSLAGPNMLMRLANAMHRLVVPRPLHAAVVHKGLGGLVGSFSQIGWAVPAELEIVEGNNQTAPAGSAVPTPPRVRLVSTHPERAPFPGQELRFRVITGGGSVSAFKVTTDANGEASVNWILGSAGANSIRVSGPASNQPLTFTATATSVVD